MKEALKIHSCMTLVIYIVIYIFYTFTIWEFRNPFQWIIDIPNYNIESRFFIIFFLSFYHVAGMTLCYSALKDKNKNE